MGQEKTSGNVSERFLPEETKKYRQEFLDTIKRAEEEIERGDGISFEEFEKEIKNWIY